MAAMLTPLQDEFNREYNRLKSECTPQPDGSIVYPLFWQVPLGHYDLVEVGTCLAELIGQARFEDKHVIPLLYWIRGVANDVTVFTRNSWADIVFENLERLPLNDILGLDGAARIRTQVTGHDTRFSNSFREWAKSSYHSLTNRHLLCKYVYYRGVASENNNIRWRVELINGECGFSEVARELTQRFFGCEWQNVNQAPGYHKNRFDEVVRGCTRNLDEIQRLNNLRDWFVRSAVFLAESFHAIQTMGHNPPDTIDEFLGWGDAPPEWSENIPNFRDKVRALFPFRRFLTNFGPPRIAINFYAGLFPGNQGEQPVPYISFVGIRGLTSSRVSLPATLTFSEDVDGVSTQIQSLRIYNWEDSPWNRLYWHEDYIRLRSWKSRLVARLVPDNGQGVHAIRPWGPGLFLLESNQGRPHWDRINREGERQLITGSKLSFFPALDSEGVPREVALGTPGDPGFATNENEGRLDLVVSKNGFVPGSIRCGDYEWSLMLGSPAYQMVQASFVAQNDRQSNLRCLILDGTGVRELYWANGLPEICLTCQFTPEADPGIAGVLARLARDNAGIALQIGSGEAAPYRNFQLDDDNATVQHADFQNTYDIFTSLGELGIDPFDNRTDSTTLRVCPVGTDGIPIGGLEQSCRLSRWSLEETYPFYPQDDRRIRLRLQDRGGNGETVLSEQITLVPGMLNSATQDLTLVANIPGDGRIQINASLTLEGIWASRGDGTICTSWNIRDLLEFLRDQPGARLFAFKPREDGSISVHLDDVEFGGVGIDDKFPRSLWNLFQQATQLDGEVDRPDRIISFRHLPSERDLGRLHICHFPVVENFEAKELPSGFVRIRFNFYRGWRGTQLKLRFTGEGFPAITHTVPESAKLMQTVNLEVTSPPSGHFLLELVGTLAGHDRVLFNQTIRIRRLPSLSNLPIGFAQLGLDQDWLWNALELLEGVMDPLQGWQGDLAPMEKLIQILNSPCYPPNTPCWYALKWLIWAYQNAYFPQAPFNQLGVDRFATDVRQIIVSHPNLVAHLTCAIFRIIHKNRQNGMGGNVPLTLVQGWLHVVNSFLNSGGPSPRESLMVALRGIQARE